MTIKRFQRLPLTAHNERLLELRPHPGAQVTLEAHCSVAQRTATSHKVRPTTED